MREFALLVAGVALVVIVGIATLSLIAESLAGYVPFRAEVSVANSVGAKLFAEDDEQADEENRHIERYLQGLADHISKAQDLPEDMVVTVHYLDDDTINAFATLGGHVFIFKGLLEHIPNENALVMVLAHEIAHIKHRHPVKGLGRAVVIGLVLSMINSSVGSDMVGDVLGDAGLLTSLTFDRSMEQQSDITALETLNVLYGHVGGADRLFHIFIEHAEDKGLDMPEFFSTHPLTENRITEIELLARKRNWTTHGAATALPGRFQQWLGLEDKLESNNDTTE